MKADFNAGNGLHYLSVFPDDYDPDANYPLVILLHGFGANMQDLAGLTPAINQTGYVYALPNAPIKFNMGLGRTGFGWTPPRGEATPEDVQNAEELLAHFFDVVLEQFHVQPGRALLMGFSQGAGMTYRCGLGRPETFAGLAALSGSLPSPEELKPRLPQDKTQPIFIAHGTDDSVVSLDNARTMRQFLEGEGYQPEYHEYPMGHEIPAVVVRDLVPWMAGVLPPVEVQV
jgi:phospholipase/carboxylesterase